MPTPSSSCFYCDYDNRQLRKLPLQNRALGAQLTARLAWCSAVLQHVWKQASLSGSGVGATHVYDVYNIPLVIRLPCLIARAKTDKKTGSDPLVAMTNATQIALLLPLQVSMGLQCPRAPTKSELRFFHKTEFARWTLLRSSSKGGLSGPRDS